METKDEYICRLCCKICEDFEVVNNLTKEILNVLLLNTAPSGRKPAIICKTCTTKVQELFEFKSKCLYTEDYIVPFSDCTSNSNLDLKDIYKRKNENVSVPDDHEVCRLCMDLVRTDSAVSLNDVRGTETERGILNEYFPELNLTEIIKEPVICSLCHTSLQSYYNFAINSLTLKLAGRQTDVVLKKTRVRQQGLQGKLSAISETTQTIFDDTVSDSFQRDQTKSQQDRRVTLYECKFCLYESDNRSNLNSHMNVHKSVTHVASFNCDICSFFTPDRSELKQHLLIHKEGSLYKCDKCPYRKRHKAQFKRHLLTHMSTTEPLFGCDRCPYRTNRTDMLREHKETHKKPLERTRYYTCKICSQKVRSKLKRHMLTHKQTGQAKTYRCKQCLYETARKDSLKVHMMTHNRDSFKENFKCDKCPYSSAYKSSLTIHMLKHKKRSEVMWHKCELCPYETKYKGGLKIHELTHVKDAETFKCYTCSYETKVKKTLATHVKMHLDESRAVMHKCKFCEFKTKYRHGLKKHVVSMHYTELFQRKNAE